MRRSEAEKLAKVRAHLENVMRKLSLLELDANRLEHIREIEKSLALAGNTLVEYMDCFKSLQKVYFALHELENTIQFRMREGKNAEEA